MRESRAALEQKQHDLCLTRAAEAGDSLLKALAAAMPLVKKDFLSMEEKSLAMFISDIASSQAEALEAASLITQLRRARENIKGKEAEDAEMIAQKTCHAADRAFEIIKAFFK